MTNPTQEDFSPSEATAKADEEVLRAQTANPVKQVPVEAPSPTQGYDKEALETVDLHQSVTPASERQEHSSTVRTWELIEKAGYPDSYQPAPEESPATDHEESHVPPAASPTARGVGEDSTLPTTDATTSESGDPSEHHTPETETSGTPVVTATSGADADELLGSSAEVPQEGDLPVLQEDHTPDVHEEHASQTESVYSSASYDVSGQPEDATAQTVEEMSAPTTSPHTEETDVHSDTPSPSLDTSTPEDHPEEEASGEESASPLLDEETQTAVTQSLVGVDTSAASELVPTSHSGQ